MQDRSPDRKLNKTLEIFRLLDRQRVQQDRNQDKTLEILRLLDRQRV